MNVEEYVFLIRNTCYRHVYVYIYIYIYIYIYSVSFCFKGNNVSMFRQCFLDFISIISAITEALCTERDR